jgi:hypothetical protein
MSFKVTKNDLKKSILCPVGMHSFTLVNVEAQYLKPNGVSVQKCDFETESGYSVSTWFNSSVMANLFEFVAAADKVTFDLEKFEEMEIKLEDYKGKKVSGSVSHRKTDDGKLVSQIDNFYEEGKVPF